MQSLYTSPESLRNFSLHFVDQNLDETLPFGSSQLSYCIKHIVALELKGCCVVFMKGDVDVTSLHGLQALSLQGSRVYGNHLGISTLTDLTSLNLTDCQWCDLNKFSGHFLCSRPVFGILRIYWVASTAGVKRQWLQSLCSTH